MYLFAKGMALFWTVAEVGILAAVRWGYHLSADKGSGFRATALGSSILLAALGFLLFFGETLAGRFIDLENLLPRTLFRWALWNFFCTLWVLLEGCIMIYVCRLYRTLHQRGRSSSGTRARPSRKKSLSLPLLALGLMGLFAAYQAGLFHAVDRYEFDLREVVRISTFYIRICGVFWILFEWVVAVQGIRAYRLLKRGRRG